MPDNAPHWRVITRDADEIKDMSAGTHAPLTLLDGLQEHTTDVLRRLMKALSVPKPLPTRKADMVQAVAVRMEDDALLSAIWEQLDPQEQMAVRETVHDDGTFNPTRFLAKYGKLPPGFRTGSNFGGKAASAAMQLLFVPSRREGPLRYLPDDLADRLRLLAPPPPPVALRTTEELPETVSIRSYVGGGKSYKTVDLMVRQMEHAAAKDLRAALRLVADGQVAVSAKTRRPAAATLRRIAAVLHEGDFYDPLAERRNKWEQAPGAIRAYAWPWLLQAARLVQLRGTKLELTRKGRECLTVPPAVTLRYIWEMWCDSNLLDEFNRVDDIKGQLRGRGRRGMTEAAGRRDVIAEALCACPTGCWVEFDDFGNFMRAASLDFGVTHDPWYLYVGNAEYGSLGYDGSNSWEILEGRYALCLLLEYAATLGLVDVAIIPPEDARDDFRHMWGTDDLSYLSRYDGLIYFRLNDLGAYCLGLAEDYQPPTATERTPLRVFPDRRVVAHGTISPEESILLETYANQEEEMVWRFDAEKILLVLEGGGDIEELRAFLAERDGQPLPETVEGFLNRMARNATALKIRGEAFLVECTDSEVAAALMADARIARMCKRAGERHLVMPAKSERAFRKAARAMGYGLRD